MRKKSLGKFCFTLLFLSFLLQPFALVNGDYAGEITSKYTTSTPLLDGTIDSAEWADANVYEAVGNEGKFDLYFMHGEDYFFIAVRVYDDTESRDDTVDIFFDEGDDGGNGSGSGDEVLTDNQEDFKRIWGDGTLRDGRWFNGDMRYFSDAPSEAINFEAVIAFHGNQWDPEHAPLRWEAEFKIPYVGNDGHEEDLSDLNIDKEDTVGIIVRFNSPRWYYPEDGDYGVIDYYVALSFEAPPPEPGPSIPGFPLEAIMLGILLTGGALVFLRKKTLTIKI